MTLQNNFILPTRTECILACKVPQSCSNQLGMISPRGESSTYHVACTVSQADNRHMPVRVTNPSNHSLEFRANQNLAEFKPVNELVSNSLNQNKPITICTTLEGPTDFARETFTELNKKSLLNTLLSYPDVFDNSVGHIFHISPH